MESFDVAIIGAGVIGCAMARRLTLDGARVVILEKALDVLDGASKGNSAILHTGFDARPGSLEHNCITAGYTEYHEIAGQLGLPILRSGALVLAWDREQLASLPDLVDKAHQNGVTDVRMLSVEEIQSREPYLVEGVHGGFEVPGESLIDPWTTAHAYVLQAILNGAELRRGTEVLEGRLSGGAWTLETGKGELRAKRVINCTGLYGDIVDQRLLGRTDFSITPRKGQFVVFDKAASDIVSAILLPVPTKTTKGIVICRTIFGNVLVGPTAEDQPSRVDASTARETLMALHDRGKKILPALAECEVTATYAGLRPASQFQDYQITMHKDGTYVSVGAIRSTGLSAALGIASYVADLLGTRDFANDPIVDPLIPKPSRLSAYHARDWQVAGYSSIVCHCELVTDREIEAALSCPMPPATLDGLKRRTRVTMGRCQGFHCTAELARITAGRLQRPIVRIDD